MEYKVKQAYIKINMVKNCIRTLYLNKYLKRKETSKIYKNCYYLQLLLYLKNDKKSDRIQQNFIKMLLLIEITMLNDETQNTVIDK